MRQFEEGATMQVAVIVRDLEAAMKRHVGRLPDRPVGCLGFQSGHSPGLLYRGGPRPTPASLLALGAATPSSS